MAIIADIKMVEQLVSGLKAKLYADRGYISQNLKQNPKEKGIELMTYYRKNMHAVNLSKADAYNLRQRNKIETLFSLLKGKYNLVTSKTRSIKGYLASIYESLCAYQLCRENKPMVQVSEALA